MPWLLQFQSKEKIEWICQTSKDLSILFKTELIQINSANLQNLEKNAINVAYSKYFYFFRKNISSYALRFPFRWDDQHSVVINQSFRHNCNRNNAHLLYSWWCMLCVHCRHTLHSRTKSLFLNSIFIQNIWEMLVGDRWIIIEQRCEKIGGM